MSNSRQEDYLTVRYGKYFGQLSIIPIILSTSIIPSTMHNVHETTHWIVYCEAQMDQTIILANDLKKCIHILLRLNNS